MHLYYTVNSRSEVSASRNTTEPWNIEQGIAAKDIQFFSWEYYKALLR
jgi:hypothetical protein